MNILYLHDYPPKEGGGVEVQTYNDALALVQRGHSVTIATTRNSSETYSGKDSLSDTGVKIAYLQSSEQIAELIDSHDVIHLQATFSLRDGLMYTLRALQEKEKNYCVSLRTSIHHIPFSHLAKEVGFVATEKLNTFKKFLENPRCVVMGVSKSLQESLDFLGVNKKLHIVYNGRDWDLFAGRNNFVPTNKEGVIYVGEISWMKGTHILLHAIEILNKQYKKIPVTLIGGGQDFENAKALAECMRLDNIKFLGYLPNAEVSQYMASSKCFVLPSLTETWGNVLMESLSMGTMPIASDIEGPAELLQNGKYGILFERGNTKKLADAIQSVLELEDEEYNRVISNSKNYITTTFTMEKRIDTLEELYRSLVLE